MSYIIALTGGIGSGKSTVAEKFASLRIPIIDADIIARQIVMPNTYALNMIRNHFGPYLLHEDSSLNRSMLKNTIFTDRKQKDWLNNLLHPLIHQETQRQLALLINWLVVVWVVPLLFENNIEHLANRILVVDVTPEEQISRIIKRDGLSQQEAKNILSNQVSRAMRLQKADDIIHNHDHVILDESIAKLHQKYLKLALLNFCTD